MAELSSHPLAEVLKWEARGLLGEAIRKTGRSAGSCSFPLRRESVGQYLYFLIESRHPKARHRALPKLGSFSLALTTK